MQTLIRKLIGLWTLSINLFTNIFIGINKRYNDKAWCGEQWNRDSTDQDLTAKVIPTLRLSKNRNPDLRFFKEAGIYESFMYRVLYKRKIEKTLYGINDVFFTIQGYSGVSGELEPK